MKTVFLFISVMSSIYLFGQKVRPKIRPKSPNWNKPIVHLKPYIYNDNDDHAKRPDFIKSFTSRPYQRVESGRVLEELGKELNYTTWTKKDKEKLAPTTTSSLTIEDIMNQIRDSEKEKVAPSTISTLTYVNIMDLIKDSEYKPIIQPNGDSIILQKINNLISENFIEDAAKEYSKLKFENPEIKGIIQQKLDEKFASILTPLDSNAIDEYIMLNTKKNENY